MVLLAAFLISVRKFWEKQLKQERVHFGSLCEGSVDHGGEMIVGVPGGGWLCHICARKQSGMSAHKSLSLSLLLFSSGLACPMFLYTVRDGKDLLNPFLSSWGLTWVRMLTLLPYEESPVFFTLVGSGFQATLPISLLNTTRF